MPRRHRVDYEGAWHHVMNRGIDREDVFADDRVKSVFLVALREACGRHGVQVHAYCLMSNHYHLLLHTPSATLSNAMQALSSTFTQSVNRWQQRDGPLFRGRYTSVVVNDDAHLSETSRYIHRNPVAAGIVADPEAWKWSSAQAYLDEKARPDWLCTGFVLTLFGHVNGREAYRKYLEETRE